MDIEITGRYCQVSEQLSDRITERLRSVEKFRDRIQRIEVQLTAEKSAKGSGGCTCEITLIARGPVVRATASADDKEHAFDAAFEKLKTQLRRAADRRKSKYKLRGNGLSADMVNEWAQMSPPAPAAEEPEAKPVAGDVFQEGDGPLVVREKSFEAEPLTLAQALDEMELVGHDFFLYVDAESGAPSVVYKRKGYRYGVIHLERPDA